VRCASQGPCRDDNAETAVLRKWQECGKLGVILSTERNSIHGYLPTIQMASLPSRNYFAVCPLVPPVSAQLSEPGGDDDRARITYRSHDNLPLGAALRTRTGEALQISSASATNDSWRIDETYVKVKKGWMYLYRAVDSEGNTLEFLLSPWRDAEAAKRFFAKALAAPHNSTPRVITVDKNAAYPKAFKELKAEATIPGSCELRQSKYLNNLVEQDHRFIKRLVKLGMGFFSFETAWRTLQGYEAMHMLRKGQIRGIEKGESMKQVAFVNRGCQVGRTPV
jgi:transposase-like protein